MEERYYSALQIAIADFLCKPHMEVQAYCSHVRRLVQNGVLAGERIDGKIQVPESSLVQYARGQMAIGQEPHPKLKGKLMNNHA